MKGGIEIDKKVKAKRRYDREYHQRPGIKEKRKEYMREYYQRVKEKNNKSTKRYRQRTNGASIKLNNMKQNAVNPFVMEDCALCDPPTLATECHHENYELPYFVYFLCRTCHGKVSRKYD